MIAKKYLVVRRQSKTRDFFIFFLQTNKQTNHINYVYDDQTFILFPTEYLLYKIFIYI